MWLIRVRRRSDLMGSDLRTANEEPSLDAEFLSIYKGTNGVSL
jgi:hypothetical protein